MREAGRRLIQPVMARQPWQAKSVSLAMPKQRKLPFLHVSQVRDFCFSPDTGLLDSIKYNRVGRQLRTTSKRICRDICSHFYLRQVRDFSFSPDTGLLDSIKYDRFGQPSIPPSVVSVFSVPVSDVLRLSFSAVTLAAQHKPIKESDGLLDRATEALDSLPVRCQLLF